MKKTFALCLPALALTIVPPLLASQVKTAAKPLTVAEKSEWKATSRFADVMDFVHSLQELSPHLRVETMATTAEGRDIPLLVIGRPLPSSPDSLRRDGRGIVYIQANIHAGEVEGKEASLMLARDILLSPGLPYLDKLVILIAPIFNADGNERIRPENRRHQNGPEQGVGVRYNSENLDLNRDSIKLESPELRGLVANVLLRWDPLILVDCHTTNGAFHQEVVTYSWGLNPNGDSAILAYQRDRMMPEVEARLEKEYGTPAVGYGGFRDFRAPEKGWETFEPQPRFVTNYIGLRNRLSILDENYVYADFKARVMGNYQFLKAILDYASGHLEEITGLVAEADRKAVLRGSDPAENATFYVEYELLPLKDPVTVHAYETEIIPRGEGQRPEIRPTGKVHAYTIPYFSNWAGKRSVRLPFAYLVTAPDPEVLAKLRQHGLAVEHLVKASSLEVEAFRIKELKSEERAFQGHHLNQVKGEYALETKEFPAGTLIIPTAQPLGALAAYLLEPESDDGLLVWNFFDRSIVPQWSRELQTYPVYRLLERVNLAREAVR
jgi:murein tripeptide amidase MpaA